MYLHLLSETNKASFMAIARAICAADGNFSDSERFMLDIYAKEMGLASIESSIAADEAVTTLAETGSDKEKRIIVLELVGLSLADEDFSAEERAFLQAVVGKFNISEEFVSQCETAVGRYLDLQNEFNQLVGI